MDNTKHTPTLPALIETGAGPDSLYLCETDGGDVLADIYDGHKEFRNELSRRYNAHEPMREALEAALCWLDPDNNATSDALTGITDKIRAALALAEKE